MTKFNLDRYAALGRFTAQCRNAGTEPTWSLEEYSEMLAQETNEGKGAAASAFEHAWTATRDTAW